MNRIDLIQALLDHCRGRQSRSGCRYLEIGIKRGGTFLAVKASHKTAVDPLPRVPRRNRWLACLRDPRNLRNRYFTVESDVFFESPPRALTQRGINVAFVDGLHTYEQSLRDVYHCLPFLRPGGALVLHDCNPRTKTSAMPLREVPGQDPSNLPGGWSGDVWKTVVHLRAMESGLRVSVLDCDCGLGVVYPGGVRPVPPGLQNVSAEHVAELKYRDLETARRELLDLRPPSELGAILEDLEG